MKCILLPVACVLLISPAAHAQKKVKTAAYSASAKPMIWENRGPVTPEEMTYGIGSKEGAPEPFPDGTFHFVREEIKSTFPKVEVVDARGHKFKVKFPNGADSKSHSEVVNNRLLWACGFRARRVYYVAAGKLDTFKPGDPKHPGAKTKMNGKLEKDAFGNYHFKDVTFTAKEDDDLAETRWGYEDADLPPAIANSPQFTWLKIFDVLVGNWDSNRRNHAIYYIKDGSAVEAWYQDKDVGTGYGTDHSGKGLLRVRPTRWNLKQYQDSRFVIWDKDRPNQPVAGDKVRFDYATSGTMEHAKQVTAACSTVSKADAKAFVEQVLNKIPASAIRAAFQASGAAPAEVDGFSAALENRIQQLRVACGAAPPSA